MCALERTFPSSLRLRQKSEFDKVYREARRFSDALFAVLVRHNERGVPRLGLSIAARVIGGAVQRNRIKRLVRESFRHQRHELPAVDIVVNARMGARGATNAEIARSLDNHWSAVKNKCASS